MILAENYAKSFIVKPGLRQMAAFPHARDLANSSDKLMFEPFQTAMSR